MPINNRFKKLLLASVMATLLPTSVAFAEESEELLDISLEDLLNITVSSASGIEESLSDAPATMVVITAKDIRQRGYDNLSEVMQDLPGFDTVITNGTNYTIAYQRGYRTPFMQRTLFMINGKVDNHLWSHAALLSRQFSMNMIQRIEVLYGPAGAVYGPNAFGGIINVITKDSANMEKGYAELSIKAGSYDTQAIDIAAGGKVGSFNINLAARVFNSDEPGLDDMAYWGFADERWLQSETYWGPLLSVNGSGDPIHTVRNNPYNSYQDYAANTGYFGDISYQLNDKVKLKYGFIDWKIEEGYGPYYAFDQAHPNQIWKHASKHNYVEIDSQINEQLNVKALLSSRFSRVYGGWTESFPDWNPGMEAYSYLSISDWNSVNDSLLFKNDFDYKVDDNWRINGGIKLENKALTKAYDLCGYWAGVFCSSYIDDGGDDGNGIGIVHSSEATFEYQPGTLAQMPDTNIVDTKDKGVYVQMIWDKDDWRINAGIRRDTNSIYGGATNPRASAVYRLSDSQTIKVLYGEAFQEPAPLALFGGWSGRAANPDLEPESMRNFEMIYILRTDSFVHHFSLYQASYENVIKESAENAGERDTQGLEYQGKFAVGNFFEGANDISGYVYYSYTKSESSQTYNHNTGQWELFTDDTGDIAPHKLNFGFNVPVNDKLSMNLKGNYASERDLYSRNPLRGSGEKLDSILTFDFNVRYNFGAAELAFKIKNLTDEDYYHPGVEAANSGRYDGNFQFDYHSSGYQNSLLPQAGRSFMLGLTWKL
ncbi:TonB-dependent siderophore receptor [Aliikangiella sp. G2MR2-5]|uniref:TonB-dependent receptor plug domain-containing protein n=1 Tax=Aliikangiella sp. G2MR2-5 TaxID=2788943 RepID=UPI0018AA40B0|nr:TonB-dependent receptor [Aliikangiella sp. G2MR2-5]